MVSALLLLQKSNTDKLWLKSKWDEAMSHPKFNFTYSQIVGQYKKKLHKYFFLLTFY
jgi:hypothetical protein